MKWLLLLLAIGLTMSEKLDRTYLPPPGAQYSGGHPGDIQAPHLPHHADHGTIPIQQSLNGLQDFGPNGPITTTSYAYTQTTTFPPAEGYETTVTPINSVTGLPGQYSAAPNNYQQYGQTPRDFIQNQGQLVHDFNGNAPREFGLQNPGSETLTIDSPNYNQANQGTPGSNIQAPGSIAQQPHAYQDYTQISTVRPITDGNGNIINRYPGQNVINPQSANQIPGTDLQNIYDNEYTGSKGSPSAQIAQGAYNEQPINVQDAQSQFVQGYPNDGTISSQPSPSRSQNILRPASAQEQNVYHPAQDYSSTPLPGSAESSSVYSPINPVFRPERPQSAAERNAVILNYENVRTPNGYFYSYDTSNGIHADETGTISDGTRAQGSYSYTGDDGKVYSVVYTADENGFRPHGDHLPTPPPIPEAIKKVIEQAARDKEAGIIDDGSYDENKYGDKKYQRPLKHRHPYNQGMNKAGNKQYYDDDRVLKPISGINNEEYNENSPQDDFVDKYFDDTQKKPIVEDGSHYPSSTVMNEINRNGIVPSRIEYSDNNRAPSRISNYKGGSNSPSGVDDYDAKQDQFESQDRLSGQIPNYARKSTKSQSKRPQAEDEDTNAGNQNEYESEFDNNHNGDFDDGSRESSVPSSTNFPSDRKQTSSKQRPKGEKITSDRYFTSQRPQSGEGLHQEVVNKQTANPVIEPGSIQNYGNYQSENQDSTQDENGYRYNPPQTQFLETEIRNRFKDQKVPPPKKPVDHKEYGKDTTARPFQTPEVYNQPSSIKPGSKQSSALITREPFMTSRVTTPKSSTYTDYDNDEDYGTDQEDDISKDSSSTRRPGGKMEIPISRSHQSSTAKPQNSLINQKQRVSQKGTVTPGIGYSDTVTPASTYKSTTATPSQSSRFGNTEPPRIQGQQNSRLPSTIVQRPGSSTMGYPGLAVISDASTKRPLAYGSRLPSAQRGSSPQYSPTSYAPSSKIPPTSDNQYSSEDLGPSSKFRSYLPSSIDTYKTGYEPVRTQYSTTGRPIISTVRPFNLATHPQSTPGYQTTYQQGHSDIGDTTPSPSTTVRPGTFILSGPRTAAPTSAPNAPYQTSYQYGSTTPVNIPTIGSSTPTTSPNYETIINYGAPGSQVSQVSPGRYEYSSPVYTYSTTASPSTIGTTPGSLIPSTISGQTVFRYPTTQQPSYGVQNNYQTPLVDAFGKPIIYEQQPGYSPGQPTGQYPGSQPGTGSNISRDNSRPAYDDQFSGYPRYDKPKFIGEDFSGPKQSQRYDPQTGYHY